MNEVITRIEPQPIKTNSSFGNWVIYYFIKWNGIGNEIVTSKHFLRKNEAIEWANKIQLSI